MTWGFETGARTLWQEARGEPLEGQVAVAWVMKNRMADGRWGESLGEVCLWPWQFSGWNGPKDPNFAAACRLADVDPLLNNLRSILQGVMTAQNDPTLGALYYYSTIIPMPLEFKGMLFLKQFGKQRFFTDKVAQV